MMNKSSNDIGFSSKGYLKKVYRIGNRTLIVIDESLVNLLSIEEDSWLEQQAIENGILMKIHYFAEKGDQDIVRSDDDRIGTCINPNIALNRYRRVEKHYVNQR
jgi:hypothetical protein